MQSETRVYSLPRWRVTRWLADCGPGVPEDIRTKLVGNLFGNLPVFFGGVINTIAVALAIVIRPHRLSPGWSSSLSSAAPA